jgi:hypothetical protein
MTITGIILILIGWLTIIQGDADASDIFGGILFIIGLALLLLGILS